MDIYAKLENLNQLPLDCTPKNIKEDLLKFDLVGSYEASYEEEGLRNF